MQTGASGPNSAAAVGLLGLVALLLLAVALADGLLLAAQALAFGLAGLGTARGRPGLGSAAPTAAELLLELAEHVVHGRRPAGRGRPPPGRRGRGAAARPGARGAGPGPAPPAPP